MSIENLNNSLTQLGQALEEIANAPSPMPEILDNQLSGNKIHGGMITQFSSVGISDQATRMVLLINDDGITVDAIDVDTISGDTNVQGSLTVQGDLTAQRLHVNELTADIRAERAESLEFVGNEVAGKGLAWRSSDYTRQFVFHRNPDRLFSTENLDLQSGKEFTIGGVPVLSADSLGTGVTNSNLTSLGQLNTLDVMGNVSFSEYMFWEASSERLGIGTEAPNGVIGIANLDSEFIIDNEQSSIRLGNWTNSDLEIITDNTTRLTIKANGNIVVGTQGSDTARMNFYGKIGVGVTNIENDVSLSTSGPISVQGMKIERASGVPSAGVYSAGDIVYNTNPQPTGYVGWVCVRAGTPGEWKPFGPIGK